MGRHSDYDRTGELKPLTAAEEEVLALILLGKESKQIAAIRGTSLATVHGQCRALRRKEDCHSRAALVSKLLWARIHELEGEIVRLGGDIPAASSILERAR